MPAGRVAGRTISISFGTFLFIRMRIGQLLTWCRWAFGKRINFSFRQPNHGPSPAVHWPQAHYELGQCSGRCNDWRVWIKLTIMQTNVTYLCDPFVFDPRTCRIETLELAKSLRVAEQVIVQKFDSSAPNHPSGMYRGRRHIIVSPMPAPRRSSGLHDSVGLRRKSTKIVIN